MPEFYIEWRIEIDAETEEAAAKRAYEIMLDPTSTATVFHVYANGEHQAATEIDVALQDDETALDIPTAAYERAAAAHGWDHGGDCGGFWYNAREFESWKAAASSDDCATYATAKEVCESEGLFVHAGL